MNRPVFDPIVGAQRLDTVTANIAMTDTGLDTIVKFALIDPGLNQQIDNLRAGKAHSPSQCYGA